MSWFWFALIPVAFWLHRKWNKKIDKEEKESYGLSSHHKDDNLGSWGVTQRFLHYLDFQVMINNDNLLLISNSKGESFSFKKPLTDTLVEYKQDNKLIKEWKFPYWVHPNKVFDTIDKSYKSELQPMAFEQDVSKKWTEKEVRPFTQEEINSIESAKVVSSQYGNSVQFNMKGGGVTYIPLEHSDNVKPGDNIDIKRCSLVTLNKTGQKELYRVRVNTTF